MHDRLRPSAHRKARTKVTLRRRIRGGRYGPNGTHPSTSRDMAFIVDLLRDIINCVKAGLLANIDSDLIPYSCRIRRHRRTQCQLNSIIDRSTARIIARSMASTSSFNQTRKTIRSNPDFHMSVVTCFKSRRCPF